MQNADQVDDHYNQDDFTTSHYRELLRLAKEEYQFIFYDEINFDQSFVLWRHDCDFSLNRSLRLAQIENEESVSSTFFLNPHCDFYNIFEKPQSKIISDILSLGHRIGLHFDSDYYDISSESELDDKVAYESGLLSDLFGQEINVFSFHNPNEFLLSCQKETYGGLINCYAKSFRDKVSYCSDSNGYWRFHRLQDFLVAKDKKHIQVLTHPGWWQETPMIARDRILRAAEGRAKALMQSYDALLSDHGRKNIK